MDSSLIPLLVMILFTWTGIAAAFIWFVKNRKRFISKLNKHSRLEWLEAHHPVQTVEGRRQFSYADERFGLIFVKGENQVFHVNLFGAEDYLNRQPGGLDTYELERLPTITFSRERSHTKKGKAIGLIREYQSGFEEFDASVFIDTEAPEPLLRQILDDAESRDHIMALLDDGWYSVSLYSAHPVAIKNSTPAPTRTDIHVFRAQLDRMCALRDRLPKIHLTGKARVARTPGHYAMILSVVVAIIGIIYAGATQWKWQVISDQFWVQAAALGFGVWGLSLVPLYLFVRGRTDSLRSLIGAGVALLFALTFSAPSVMRNLNARFDTSAPVSVEVEVIDREHHKSDDGDTYYLTFEASDHTPRFRLKVREKLWRQVEERAHLTIREGALDTPWIVSIEPL